VLATTVGDVDEEVGDLAEWTAENYIGLTVVGPEAPLAAGLVDAFAQRGLRAFGPTARAAEIEASKCWAWGFMERQGISAPRARECTDVPAGLVAVDELGLPVAVKADGLAAGKGVVLARTREEARQALAWMLEQGGLGAAGRRVLIQELLEGPEL